MRLAAARVGRVRRGRNDEAVRLLTEGAEKEEAVGKHPVTPGAILPARELLGDLLLELKRPQKPSPPTSNRSPLRRSVQHIAGAARAADAAGQAHRPQATTRSSSPCAARVPTAGSEGRTVVPIAAVSRGGAPSAESATI